MKSLTEIEREARRTRELIAELKTYTPKFNVAKERAEEELLVHLDKINVEREHLEDLKDAAALIVEHLGTDVPVEMLRTQEERVLEAYLPLGFTVEQTIHHDAWSALQLRKG
jgi:ribosomal protein L11 methyltransferase